MDKRKAGLVVLILVLVIGTIAGGIFAYKEQHDKKTKVKVYSVENLGWGIGDDEASYSSGTVTDDQSQTVYLQDDDVVEEVYVKKGDVVSEGDQLFRYNMEEANLNLEMKELELSTAENDLVIAQRELERLRATTPIPESVPEPEPEEEPKEEPMVEEKSGDAYNIIDTSKKAFEGKGTEEKPFRFLCTSEAYVTGGYLNYLKEKSYVAVFEIHKDNRVEETILNAWLVNGSSLEDHYVEDEKWSIANRSQIEEEPETEEEPEEYDEEPEGYTALELAAEISAQQKKIRELDIQMRKTKLEVEQLRAAAGDGIVKATVNGTVASVQDLEELDGNSTPFLEIRGQDSLYVTGSMSELLLEEVEVGQKVLINSWESGQNYEGTITEISTTPTDNMGYGGEGNPNVSYYPYKALVENSEGLRNGEGVELRIDPNAQTKDALYIEQAFVRTESGKSYVMKEGKDKRLKKQYVKTGKIVYGQAIQILSGLKNSDFIAFPYGKEVKEGARVKETDEMDY